MWPHGETRCHNRTSEPPPPPHTFSPLLLHTHTHLPPPSLLPSLLSPLPTTSRLSTERRVMKPADKVHWERHRECLLAVFSIMRSLVEVTSYLVPCLVRKCFCVLSSVYRDFWNIFDFSSRSEILIQRSILVPILQSRKNFCTADNLGNARFISGNGFMRLSAEAS